MDYGYVGRAVGRQAAEAGLTPEVRLLQMRLGVLTGAVPPETAAEQYRPVEESAAPDASFTWTGAKDRSRLDSFFDPFGALTVRQRAAVERARALYRLGRVAEAEAVRDVLAAALPAQKAAQLRSYWPAYARDAR